MTLENTPHLEMISPQDRAFAYAAKISNNSFDSTNINHKLHCYTDEDRTPIYWKLRVKDPETGKKWIRAFSKTSDEIFHTKEPDFQTAYPTGKGRKPLYRLDRLANATSSSIIFIVEGEQKADALIDLGLFATTSGGAGTVNSTFWQSLAIDCKIRIWRDNDPAGLKYQDEVIACLYALGYQVSYIDIDPLDLPPKGDVIDWLNLRLANQLNTTSVDVLDIHAINAEFNQPNSINTANTQLSAFKSKVWEVADLTPMDYEFLKKSVAQDLGIPTKKLDQLVKQAQSDKADLHGSFLTNIELWGEPVNGANLLDEIVAIINEYIVCEQPTMQSIALWIAFSWCIDAMQISPIACITAPEKQCGKTILLTLIKMLCKKPLLASNITSAALYRSISTFSPTLLIDEADTFLKDNTELRGIINSGHTRQSAFVIRTVGDNHEPHQFSTWGAKAICGIGHLPETLRDRSIIFELQRKKQSEQRQRLRHADPKRFERIKSQLARWSQDHIETLKNARPELPEALSDRSQDNWESLLAIADLVGDHWPITARHAAISISSIKEKASSINEQLLADIEQIFLSKQTNRLASSDLLVALCADPESMWATWFNGQPMTARQLSKRLKEFRIKTKTLRKGDEVFRGYELGDFTEALSRYVHTGNKSFNPYDYGYSAKVQ